MHLMLGCDSVTDLKIWLNVPRVVQDCLDLLHFLATGYSTSKLLVNLDAAKTLLQNHGVFSHHHHLLLRLLHLLID